MLASLFSFRVGFGAMMAKWQTLVKTAGYRPERHYMRGRGPMWHAKNQLAEERITS